MPAAKTSHDELVKSLKLYTKSCENLVAISPPGEVTRWYLEQLLQSSRKCVISLLIVVTSRFGHEIGARSLAGKLNRTNVIVDKYWAKYVWEFVFISSG